MGTSTEINNIDARFLLPLTVDDDTNSVDNFTADRPKSCSRCFTMLITMILTIIRTPSADYSVLLSSVYLQDEIRLSLNSMYSTSVDWQAY
jgi:hypothetical protein